MDGKTRIYCVLLVSAVVFAGCSGDDGGSSPGTTPQFVVATAYYLSPDYFGNLGGSAVEGYAPTMGEVFAPTLPTFEYYKVGNKTFSGDDYCCHYPGYLSFGEACRWETFGEYEDQYATTGLDPLTVEVKTSFGNVSASVGLPDTISNLAVSTYNLGIGQPFTITWAGDADFYWVSWTYQWDDGYYDWGYVDADTMIVGKALILAGSNFTHDGWLTIESVTPMNGPFPQPGAGANMSGKGSGFLYYTNYSNYWDTYREVTVGAGYRSRTAEHRTRVADKAEAGRLLHAISTRLGLGPN